MAINVENFILLGCNANQRPVD